MRVDCIKTLVDKNTLSGSMMEKNFLCMFSKKKLQVELIKILSETVPLFCFMALFPNNNVFNSFIAFYLTLKAPRKTASENAICLCRLLNILANFSNLFLHTGKQCGP